MTKRIVWKCSQDISHMNGEEVVEALDAFCELTGKTRAEVGLKRDYSEDYCNIMFGAAVKETDEEYAARLLREEAQKQLIEKARRIQYETLKKEFGE